MKRSTKANAKRALTKVQGKKLAGKRAATRVHTTRSGVSTYKPGKAPRSPNPYQKSDPPRGFSLYDT